MTGLQEAFAAWGDFNNDDPFPLFAETRARGPVHAVTLADGHDAYLVVGYDEARAALNDTRISKDMHAALARSGAVVAEGLPGPAFARHMLVVDPPDHTRLRKLVASAFSVRRVEGMHNDILQIVTRMLDAIEAQGDAVIDLIASYAFPLPFTVICELLGVPDDWRHDFGNALVAMLVPTNSAEEFAQAKIASDQVVKFLEDLVEAKRHTPDGALVSALITARDGDDRLTEQELLSTMLQLIIAGHDTTSSLIGNSVVALLTHPEQLARLQSDPGVIPHAIEELIRYDAPVPHSTFRYTLEEIELGGVTIPAGAQVIVNLASANRDATHFAGPDTLDVTRADARHLGFGHGIHFCLGAPLARMEGKLALGELFRRFPDLRLAVPVDELHWDHGDGLVLRGLTALPVLTRSS